MPDTKWGWNLHRPMKFGEGMLPDTVEWERQKRQRRAQMEHWREVKRQTEPTSKPDGPVMRVLKALFRIRWRG